MTDVFDPAMLRRIAEALERLAPPAQPAADVGAHEAFVWHASPPVLEPVDKVNRVDIHLLKGIDLTRDILLENTERFAKGLPANNALLWGARGMGKSSLVKAAHAQVNGQSGGVLKLVEIHREDIESLPVLMSMVRKADQFRFIVFCDDLSFDADDTSYKSLKAALDGGIEGRPTNMIFYATSNRRHLLPRAPHAIHPPLGCGGHHDHPRLAAAAHVQRAKPRVAPALTPSVLTRGPVEALAHGHRSGTR